MPRLIAGGMSLDTATVRRVAALARIRLEEGEVAPLQAELNGILGWIEQLRAIDTSDVPPMAGGRDMALRMRDDLVTEGGAAEAVLANAPDRRSDYFLVPKVVE
jgi:aspartyl-tRNA(Asn)/glutamyl-tRNA(Gln) amidotransferase subunit C